MNLISRASVESHGNVKARSFRSAESYEAERVTRDMLSGFLSRRGFRVVTDTRERNGQTIVAEALDSNRLTMRVRLCWRRGSGSRDSSRVRRYSGAQLLAHIQNDNPEQSLREKIQRERSHGVTHFLLIQREDERIIYAALIPLPELLAMQG